jgi:putative endonuclease
MHYLYILYSPSADQYYVGQTPDMETRLLFHNYLSETSFTSRHRPWHLKRAIAVSSRSEAVRLENYIKGRKSKAYKAKLANDPKTVEKLLDKLGIQEAEQ